MNKFKFKELFEYDDCAIDPKEIDDTLLLYVGHTLSEMETDLKEINESINELQVYSGNLGEVVHRDLLNYLGKLPIEELLNVLFNNEESLENDAVIYNSIEFPSSISSPDYNSEVYDQITWSIDDYLRKMKEWYRFVESFIQNRTYAVFKKGVVIYVNEEGIIVTDKEVPKESIDMELQDNLRKLIKKYGKATVEKNMGDIVE